VFKLHNLRCVHTQVYNNIAARAKFNIISRPHFRNYAENILYTRVIRLYKEEAGSTAPNKIRRRRRPSSE